MSERTRAQQECPGCGNRTANVTARAVWCTDAACGYRWDIQTAEAEADHTKAKPLRRRHRPTA